MVRQSLVRKLIELAACCVTLDLFVETVSVECLEPSAERRKLMRRQLRDGLLDVLNGGHGW